MRAGMYVDQFKKGDWVYVKGWSEPLIGVVDVVKGLSVRVENPVTHRPWGWSTADGSTLPHNIVHLTKAQTTLYILTGQLPEDWDENWRPHDNAD